jgi:hypothetical protein
VWIQWFSKVPKGLGDPAKPMDPFLHIIIVNKNPICIGRNDNENTTKCQIDLPAPYQQQQMNTSKWTGSFPGVLKGLGEGNEAEIPHGTCRHGQYCCHGQSIWAASGTLRGTI